jgi:uncharacterized protein involved in exopolysaccharide biosynthesis
MAPNRKSLRTQIDEVNDAISKLAEEEKPAPAKCNMLVTQLETLRFLLQTELSTEKETLVAENESLKKRIEELTTPRAPTENELLDARVNQSVAAMLARHNAADAKATIQLPVHVPTLTRDEGTSHIAMPRSRPAEDDGFIT